MPQTIMEALRDPAWQFIGAIIAFLGLVVAIWIYWLQKQTRELAFGLISSRRPLAIADELSSRVTVQLDGKPVQNLHLLVFALKNSGKRAITPSDYERNLSISFPGGQVVSADISSQSPPNLGGQLLNSESSIEVSPLLLNSGDYLLIQVLLSAKDPKWEVNVRILEISSFAPINTYPPFFKSGAPLLMFVMLLIGLGNLFFGKDKALAYYFITFAILILPLMSVIQKFFIAKASRSVPES